MLGAPASSLVTDSVKKKKKAPGACQGLEGNFFFFFFLPGWVTGLFGAAQTRLRDSEKPHGLMLSLDGNCRPPLCPVNSMDFHLKWQSGLK